MKENSPVVLVISTEGDTSSLLQICVGGLLQDEDECFTANDVFW